MSEFQIGQIFENEYPPEVASFCLKNNCKIEVTGTVERTVQSHVLEGKQAYAVFADASKIKLWPYNKKKYAVGQTVAMKQYKIVEIPAPSVDELKTEKLSQLDSAFLQWYETDAVVTSSLGFVADSDSRAMMDVSGLVTTLESQPVESRSTVAFMDANNQTHLLSLEQLKTVQVEIIQNGQSAYQQKWSMRAAIEQATTKEELEAIKIEFVAEDFSA
ncbi:DUF4376 domain-containing protein [Parasutterella secunda]|uniref:DUF4376 domain-containing protein n=1 Tax=Parasutterella secunda TaxID=626947 RepID=UPI0025A43764|nr:DUF4376 domain-containing protein [Parasutterella secunda]MDM8227770.1 DUF4376 domain-containing protein [Parasutterella secunda]